jgi:hypothetical protein
MIVCRTATVSAPRTASAYAGRALAREFPTVTVQVDAETVHDPTDAAGTSDASVAAAAIDVGRWNDHRQPFEPFDAVAEAMAQSPSGTLSVQAAESLPAAERAALELLTRWQWLIGRRNEASSTPEFDSVLERLANLYAVDKPLVRADYVHALDTWQWLLRLDPRAGAAVQMAALLHDVERLESEADARVEHRAPDYVRFKTRHAHRGARMAYDVLESCGVGSALRARTTLLVRDHESPGHDAERGLLNDADALSFFSRNSAGYADYFGPAQTRRKIAYTLGRMREAARERLTTVRLRDDVERLLVEVGDDVRGLAIAAQGTAR